MPAKRRSKARKACMKQPSKTHTVSAKPISKPAPESTSDIRKVFLFVAGIIACAVITGAVVSSSPPVSPSNTTSPPGSGATTPSSNLSWSQDFDYDQYGNRIAVNGVPIPIERATNRLNGPGYSYDAVGNLIKDPNGNTYDYDAENRLIKATGNNATTTYLYDGEGRRVKKTATTTVGATTKTVTTRFFYSYDGRLLAEYEGPLGVPIDLKKPTKEYVYGPSGLLAVVEGDIVKFVTPDHLGTPRVITDGRGNVVSRHDYMPFGQELMAGTGGRTIQMGYGAPDNIRQHFTGQPRDMETGLDYFGARYYGSPMGRFMSPDPLAGNIRNPQSLNRYSYALNNPLKYNDPTGLDVTVSGQYKEDFVNLLQKATSLKVALNAKTNKLEIVGADSKDKLKAIENSLKTKGDKELFKAITDQEHHATINTVKDDGSIDFSRFEGGGTNTVDVGDIAKFSGEGSGGITPEQVAGHETVEAFQSSLGKSQHDAHEYAGKVFAGLGPPSDLYAPVYESSAQKYQIGELRFFPVQNSKAVIGIIFNYRKPVPSNMVVPKNAPHDVSRIGNAQ